MAKFDILDLSDGALLARAVEAEAKVTAVREIVELWFRPWGAAKGAEWETLTGDQPFNPEVALRLIREAVTE